MTLKELWQIAKSITLGDIIGCLSLFAFLWIGLLWIYVAT
jgi:hypothetical protein